MKHCEMFSHSVFPCLPVVLLVEREDYYNHFCNSHVDVKRGKRKRDRLKWKTNCQEQFSQHSFVSALIVTDPSKHHRAYSMILPRHCPKLWCPEAMNTTTYSHTSPLIVRLPVSLQQTFLSGCWQLKPS